jgi:integrase
MKVKLTKRLIDAAVPTSKDLFLWDSSIPGFGLKITPKDARVFVLQYWAPRLKQVRRRYTIGPFGALTVEQARTEAERLRGLIASGEDPAAAKKQAREGAQTAAAETLTRVSTLYLAECRAKMKQRTADEYERLFRVYILPVLGARPVSAVSTRELHALHLKYARSPYQANRILQLLRAFFSWSERTGYRPRQSNPCYGITAFPERSRERFLTGEEVGRLGAALEEAEQRGLRPAPRLRKAPKSAATAKHRPKGADTPIPANPLAVAAIRLLLLTGWREQEALTLRWQDVDLSRGAATLPDTKTGKSHRPMGVAACELLAGLPRLHNSEYVFPGADPAHPLREIKRVWTAARHAAGLDDVRLHDLRHTVASFAVGGGHSLYLTGSLLGHARAETTQRYAHLADDARKSTADAVSAALSAALRRQKTEVTPLRKAGGEA